MIADDQTCKVLDFEENWAEVYYYNKEGGSVITVIYNNNKWIMDEWNTIWSRTGSADSAQWPYIWHNLSC